MVKTVQDIINEKAQERAKTYIRDAFNTFRNSGLLNKFHSTTMFVTALQKTGTDNLTDSFLRALLEVNVGDFITSESENFVKEKKDGT